MRLPSSRLFEGKIEGSLFAAPSSREGHQAPFQSYLSKSSAGLRRHDESQAPGALAEEDLVDAFFGTNNFDECGEHGWNPQSSSYFL